MTRLYDRTCRLHVGSAGGTLDLSEFRVRFRITDPVVQTPRAAVIRITNLSDATARSIPKRGGRIALIAGYVGLYSKIFSGEVRARNIGRESPTDTYIDIFAADGLKPYQEATVSKSLPPKSSGKDIYNVILEAMKPYGITAGNIPKILSETIDPRSQVHFGMARDVLRKLAQSLGCTWSIRDGRLNVVPAGEALPGDDVILNSNTGLIGRPMQTEQGIVGRSLLNPRIQANSKIKIDERSIDLSPFDLSARGDVNKSEPNLGQISTDGTYKVLSVNHTGDTRGEAWYSEFVCNALGASTTAQTKLGRA